MRILCWPLKRFRIQAWELFCHSIQSPTVVPIPPMVSGQAVHPLQTIISWRHVRFMTSRSPHFFPLLLAVRRARDLWVATLAELAGADCPKGLELAPKLNPPGGAGVPGLDWAPGETTFDKRQFSPSASAQTPAYYGYKWSLPFQGFIPHKRLEEIETSTCTRICIMIIVLKWYVTKTSFLK